MRLTKLAVLAAFATSTAAYAQDNDVVDVDANSDTDVVDVDDSFNDNTDTFNDSFDDNSDNFIDSFDDNSDNYNDSFDDNSETVIEDSFDDNSEVFTSNLTINAGNHTFGDSAIVAETTLSNVVTGVDVDFGDVSDSAGFDSSLANSGRSFQNYAGMNALNQNTGTGASQNASVTIAVSSDGFDVN